jgi:hypothetical protein
MILERSLWWLAMVACMAAIALNINLELFALAFCELSPVPQWEPDFVYNYCYEAMHQ